MIYKEEIKDLFSCSNEYWLAHCISADFGMGKGIVVEFNRRFDQKNRLMTNCQGYLDFWIKGKLNGSCIVDSGTKVLNLITKERYWQKPTYLSMQCALYEMAAQCQVRGIKKIAMPIIGCGLDKLEWDKVSAMIQETFKDTDIEILVCRQT